ncbi:efflux RND transporter periplasmic adaptor subunit [bacterium]|nr:efflux RND transporter periplasmic adaptor subunit [bacterium]
MRKKTGIAIAALVVAVFVWRLVLLLGGEDTGGSGFGGKPAVAVETDSVQTGPVREIRRFTGTVRPLYQYVIAPKVSGRLLQLNKRIGDKVGAGEIVGRLDDDEVQQGLREAEANLEIARAGEAEARSRFQLARQELDRAQNLQEGGFVTEADLEVARSRFEAEKAGLELAKAQVQQREAALERARIQLGYTQLTAPREGYVAERYVDEGTLLRVNDAVLRVVEIDTVIVQASIIEREYGRLQVGQEAGVRVDAYPDAVFTGRVTRIAPVLREETRVAEMELEVINRDGRLKPGMFADVTVVLADKARTTIVPLKALVRVGEQDAVYMVEQAEDGPVARRVPVQMGIRGVEAAEILEPQLSGRVITLGQHLLSDGNPILLPEHEGKSSGDLEADVAGGGR